MGRGSAPREPVTVHASTAVPVPQAPEEALAQPPELLALLVAQPDFWRLRPFPGDAVIRRLLQQHLQALGIDDAPDIAWRGLDAEPADPVEGSAAAHYVDAFGAAFDDVITRVSSMDSECPIAQEAVCAAVIQAQASTRLPHTLPLPDFSELLTEAAVVVLINRATAPGRSDPMVGFLALVLYGALPLGYSGASTFDLVRLG